MLKMSLGLNNTQRGVTQRGERKKSALVAEPSEPASAAERLRREKGRERWSEGAKKKQHILPLSCGARCEKQKCCCGSIQANSREAFITDNCRRLLTCACVCVIKDVCVYSLMCL